MSQIAGEPRVNLAFGHAGGFKVDFRCFWRKTHWDDDDDDGGGADDDDDDGGGGDDDDDRPKCRTVLEQAETFN